ARRALDQVEGRGADRSGRAEDRDRLHSSANNLGSTTTSNAAAGATGTTPSNRSSTPPCPGSSVPLSFAPARRLSQLSNRSPHCASTARKGVASTAVLPSPHQ